MKNINSAICAAVISLVGATQGFCLDLDKLTTKDGKVYHQISVINSDKNGLLFRHSAGATKVSFDNLSANIRDLFEPTAETNSKSNLSTHPKSSHLPTDKNDSHRHASKATEQDYVLTIVVRRPVSQHQAHCQQQLSLRHPSPCHWPRHVHPVHRVHFLQNPYYRAQANLNFLRLNGLLPASCHNHGRILANQRFY